jgi:hypothetical protein
MKIKIRQEAKLFYYQFIRLNGGSSIVECVAVSLDEKQAVIKVPEGYSCHLLGEMSLKNYRMTCKDLLPFDIKVTVVPWQDFYHCKTCVI